MPTSPPEIVSLRPATEEFGVAVRLTGLVGVAHLAIAAAHHRILQIGHLERFNPAVRAALPVITRPMFFEVHRLSIFTPRSLDIDVVLDLMIHDLDLVLALVDSPIRSVDALGAAVSSPLEDIANARVRFENGCVATITASRISLKTERRMRLFSEEGYLSADFVARKLSMIGRERGGARSRTAGGRPGAGAASPGRSGQVRRRTSPSRARWGHARPLLAGEASCRS